MTSSESEDITLSDGQMCFFAPTVESLAERREARKESVEKRVQKAKEIAEAADGQALVWCDFNDESEKANK